jgi:secreted trypsin-like serine protease
MRFDLNVFHFQPFFINTGKNCHVIIGVTSWGIGCATENPGIFAKVSTNLKWIKDNIKT